MPIGQRLLTKPEAFGKGQEVSKRRLGQDEAETNRLALHLT